jgi:hypothetical protein
MANSADIGDSTASDIIQAAREAADVGGFESGSQVLERRQRIGKLSWQIDEVDQLLQAGVIKIVDTQPGSRLAPDGPPGYAESAEILLEFSS